MGLDDFKTDDNKSTSSESTEEENKETTSEDDESTLDQFRTDSTATRDGDDEDGIGKLPWFDDFTMWEWKMKSKAERVKYIRENYIEDWHPEFQPDERWSYSRTIEVACVCGNTVTFYTKGVCMDCGREYKDAGRTVVKIHEPKEQTTHGNNR